MQLHEKLFINRDNTIRLKLYEDEVAFTTKYPSNPPTRFILTIGSKVIDSNIYTSAFNWSPVDSVVELDIGSTGLTVGTYWAKLVVYSDIWINGVVWIHPTDTPDKLQIEVLA